MFSLRTDLLNVLMKTELVYKFGIYFQNMLIPVTVVIFVQLLSHI